MVKREKIGWIFIWTVAAIGLVLSLCFFAGVPNAQELTKEALSAKAAKAKVGDVLTKYDAVELIKADANKITAKIYATPKWDKQGNLLVAYETGTGIIRTQGKYVQYVPNAATGLLKVTRTTTETGVKEYWNVPDSKTTALAWAVNTDAAVSLADGRMVFTDRGKVICESPAPVAWDAKKKPVGITVKFDGKILTYDIAPGEYAYPVTVDPSVIVEEIDATTGYIRYNGGATYDQARNATSGSASGSDKLYIGQDTGYSIIRPLLRFDTSGLSAMVPIDSASIKVVVAAISGTWNMRVCDTTDSLATGYLNNSMYNEIKGWAASGAYTVTYLSDTIISSSGKSAGDTLAFVLNAAGLSNIDRDGITQCWILSANDIAAIAPTDPENGTFEDDSPYLQVWYTPGPSTGLTRSVPYDKRPNYIWKNGDTVPIWKP